VWKCRYKSYSGTALPQRAGPGLHPPPPARGRDHFNPNRGGITGANIVGRCKFGTPVIDRSEPMGYDREVALVSGMACSFRQSRYCLRKLSDEGARVWGRG
jgi:hypothetical protein